MNLLQQLIASQPLRSTQHNHALEHATLNVLAEKGHAQALAGYSDPTGFRVVGEVETEKLLQAAQEALLRLQTGDVRLAIHENCGTNFAVSGMLAGLAAWGTMLGASGVKSKLSRLPAAVTLATITMILSRPLGKRLQADVTTRADVGDLQILEIRRQQYGSMLVHRILTRQTYQV